MKFNDCLIYRIHARDKQAAHIHWQVDEAVALEFRGGSNDS